MEKEFVTYELAVKLKALGFDEECLSYYFNKQGGASMSLINDKNNRWITKQDYIDSMVRTQLLWWPTKKFNTPEEQDTFAAKNANTLPDLRKAASEVLEIMIKFNLVSF